MEIFALSFVAFALAALGLGLGVLLGRRPIEGSCGGVATGGGCEFCGDKRPTDGPGG